MSRQLSGGCAALALLKETLTALEEEQRKQTYGISGKKVGVTDKLPGDTRPRRIPILRCALVALALCAADFRRQRLQIADPVFGKQHADTQTTLVDGISVGLTTVEKRLRDVERDCQDKMRALSDGNESSVATRLVELERRVEARCQEEYARKLEEWKEGALQEQRAIEAARHRQTVNEHRDNLAKMKREVYQEYHVKEVNSQTKLEQHKLELERGINTERERIQNDGKRMVDLLRVRIKEVELDQRDQMTKRAALEKQQVECDGLKLELEQARRAVHTEVATEVEKKMSELSANLHKERAALQQLRESVLLEQSRVGAESAGAIALHRRVADFDAEQSRLHAELETALNDARAWRLKCTHMEGQLQSQKQDASRALVDAARMTKACQDAESKCADAERKVKCLEQQVLDQSQLLASKSAELSHVSADCRENMTQLKLTHATVVKDLEHNLHATQLKAYVSCWVAVA